MKPYWKTFILHTLRKDKFGKAIVVNPGFYDELINMFESMPFLVEFSSARVSPDQ